MNNNVNQRDYRSMQSTNRQFYSVEMSQYNPLKAGFNNLSRDTSKKLFQQQQKMLQRSLSKQSGQLYGSAKGRDKKYEERSYSSKGTGRSKNYNKNNSYKNMNDNDINNVVNNIYASSSQDRNNKNDKNSNKNDNILNENKNENRDENNNNNKVKQVQPQISSNKFTFSFISYIAQIFLAYGITIGIMYLITVSNFPFFQILLVFGLMFSISPWSLTNTLMLVACAVIIANFFLKIQALTYPIILICYFSVLIFNQHNKNKIIFIPTLVVVVIWGFIVIPSLFVQFKGLLKNVQGFYYIFPLFVFMIRMFLYIAYRWIKYTQYIFLQLPLFILGLQYGVMMTLSVSSIQFWYLMVFYTLQIVNDRTQFMLKILVNIWKSCDNSMRVGKKNGKVNKNNNQQNNANNNNSLSQQNIKNNEQGQSQKQLKIHQKDISILPAHASGYSSLHSLHIVCIVYVFTKLPLYSQPYTNDTRLYIYIQNQFYIPLVIWALGFAYQAMCLVLERKRRDKLLIGFTNNGIVHTIVRGFMLTIGLWMFYLGLGIGNYAVYGQKM